MLGLATLLKVINHEAQKARDQNYAHNMSTEEAVSSIKRARNARRGVGSKLGKLAKTATVCVLLSMGGNFVINHLDNNGSQVSQSVQTGVSESENQASKYFGNDAAEHVSLTGDEFKQTLLDKDDHNNHILLRNVPNTDIVDAYLSHSLEQNNPEARNKAEVFANLAVVTAIKNGKHIRFSEKAVHDLGLKVIQNPVTGRAETITKEMYNDATSGNHHLHLRELKTDQMSGNVIPEESSLTRSISDRNADFMSVNRTDYATPSHTPSHPQHHSSLPDNSFGIGMGN